MKDLLDAYAAQLILCPYCGGDGEFVTVTYQDIQAIHTKCKVCGHISVEHHLSKVSVIRLLDDWCKGSPPTPKIILPESTPIVLNYGVGVDSTSLLVEMVRQGIRPDLIIFADPKGEKPETYAYLDYFDTWLQAQGFPKITRVSYIPATAPYNSLEGNCLSNATLPSISFRQKSCTLKFKAAVIDAFLLGISRGPNKREGWAPAIEARSRGALVVKILGYDAGPADSCRSVNLTEDKNFRYLYPLRDLNWVREDCILAIKKAGLVVPLKSACYYCCSSKPWEVMWLAAEHPDLLKRALVIEDNARAGKHGLGNVQGLWGQKESWREFCEVNKIIEPGTYTVIADSADLLREARKTKPPLENNLDFSLPIEDSHLEPLRMAA